ncbi:hypothetical protein [Streptomyces sp. NPDC090022]|uniref:hypothetical protein n=1 Tax=Streptomyces sp. NPDC090022 TaxID=3365920 RepID=UPI003818CACE
MTLRVLFVALTILTCGFFAWASMLKIAIVTRSLRNWLLFGVTVVINIVCIALLGTDKTPDGETSRGTDIAMITSLTLAIAVVAYFLYEDIRHYAATPRPAAATWYPQPQPQVPPAAPYYKPPEQRPGYGFPPGAGPMPPHTPTPTPTPVPTPAPGPAGPPQAPRIGQVRAELDELSELLRREDGGQGQGPQGQDPHGHGHGPGHGHGHGQGPGR